jgi:hypothetical protein
MTESGLEAGVGPEVTVATRLFGEADRGGLDVDLGSIRQTARKKVSGLTSISNFSTSAYQFEKRSVGQIQTGLTTGYDRRHSRDASS